nr:protein NRT1/ PTR FAMILY 1.2-like [Ipomoea batatas]GME06300.1 protein NRT1/ PTR FAMILY 1.2-like [Ipomoea batatas]
MVESEAALGDYPLLLMNLNAPTAAWSDYDNLKLLSRKHYDGVIVLPSYATGVAAYVAEENGQIYTAAGRSSLIAAGRRRSTLLPLEARSSPLEDVDLHHRHSKLARCSRSLKLPRSSCCLARGPELLLPCHPGSTSTPLCSTSEIMEKMGDEQKPLLLTTSASPKGGFRTLPFIVGSHSFPFNKNF